MRKRLILFLLIIAQVSCLTCAATAGAVQTAAPEKESETAWAGEMDATLGYDGQITYLRSLPLNVTIANNDADITDGFVSICLDRDQSQYDEYRAPVSVARGARVTLTIPVYLTGKQGSYVVQLTENGRTLKTLTIKPRRTFNPVTLMVGLLSANPDALAYMNLTSANDPLARGELWQTFALTAETFPDQSSLLDAFSILVVDGFDLSALSQKQKAVFDQWLEKGGIVLVGGGAQGADGWSYFSDLSAGAPYETPDISQALFTYLDISGKPMGVPTLLCAVTGGQSPLVSDGRAPLVYLTSIGSGLLYRTTFSLSDKPLSAFLSGIDFFQRLLLKTAKSRYSTIAKGLQSYYGLMGGTDYLDSSVTSQMPVENGGGALLPVLLAVLFLLVAGFGGYLLLKKFDKREWLWAVVPLSALVCGGLIYLTGSLSSLRSPIAVTVSQLSISGGATTMKTTLSVSSASSAPMTVSAANADITLPYSSFGGYYDPDSNISPAKLRYTYTFSDNAALTLPVAAPWTVSTMRAQPYDVPTLSIAASIRRETDGLHAEIENKSDRELPAGLVLTKEGYASVPSLAPGQRAEVVILRDAKREKALSGTVDYDHLRAIKDGVMLTPEQISFADIYSVLYASIFPEAQTDGDKASALPASIVGDTTRAEMLALYQSCMNSWNGALIGHYLFVDSGLIDLDLSCGGSPIIRKTSRTVVDVAMDYIPQSSDGALRYPAGYIAGTEGALNTVNIPIDTGNTLDPNSWYNAVSLQNEPIYCFTLPKEALGISIETFNLTFSYNPVFKLKLYNTVTAAWDNVSVEALPTGDQFTPYVNADGQLFIRCVPGTAGQTDEIQCPTLTLEGRVK